MFHGGLWSPHADAGVAPLLHEGDETPVADDRPVRQSLEETLLGHACFDLNGSTGERALC